MHFFPHSTTVKTTWADGHEKSLLKTELLKCRFKTARPRASCLFAKWLCRHSPATRQSKTPPSTSSTSDQTLNFTRSRIYLLKCCNFTGTSWGLWLNFRLGPVSPQLLGAVISPVMEGHKLPPTNTKIISNFFIWIDQKVDLEKEFARKWDPQYAQQRHPPEKSCPFKKNWRLETFSRGIDCKSWAWLWKKKEIWVRILSNKSHVNCQHFPQTHIFCQATSELLLIASVLPGNGHSGYAQVSNSKWTDTWERCTNVVWHARPLHTFDQH